MEAARRARVETLANVLHGATPAELDLVSQALTVVRRGLRG
jgi:hypothetical protein